MVTVGSFEKLLGDKRGFVELREQKRCVCDLLRGTVIQPFPLVEQGSSQGRQTDRGDVEVEGERQARVKSAPVLPTDRERRARGDACSVSQLVRVAGRATEGSHKRSANESSRHSLTRVGSSFGGLSGTRRTCAVDL